MWLRFCHGLRENATKPPDGRTPRVTANSTTSMSPTQKPGTEMPSVMAAISGRVHHRPRCSASTSPSGTAISTASRSDRAVSSSVTGSAAASKVVTGLWLRLEAPRLPWAVSANHNR
jgi:hypothetical protein